MSCCFKILPIRVLQVEGEYFPSPAPLAGYFQRSWNWSPVIAERAWNEANPSAGSVSHDFDTAFDGMDDPILVDFPEELKAECVHADEDGTSVSYTFRFEWPDSPDCGGDGPVQNLACSIGLRVITCGPVLLKASATGRVERLRSVNDTSPLYYSVYDHLSVWTTRLGPSTTFSAPGCLQTSGDKVLIYSAGTGDDDGDCTMRRRVSCGSTRLCEGETALQIYCATGDGFHHEGGYYDLTLTFACGLAGADCDEEEEDPDYFPPERDDEDPDPPEPPCTGHSEYPGEDEDCLPPQPPETPPGTPCICDDCALYAILITISGLLDSGCNFSPFGNLYQNYASNLNGSYRLIYNSDESVWEQILGTEGDISDPGVLLETNYFEFDPGGDGDDVQYDVYVWRIKHLGIFCDADGIKSIASVQFDRQCFEHDPLTPAIGTWVSGTPCAKCDRIESFTNLLTSSGGDGCSGQATYSNEYNEVWEPDGGSTVCFCVTDDSYATMIISPDGVSGGCLET